MKKIKRKAAGNKNLLDVQIYEKPSPGGRANVGIKINCDIDRLVNALRERNVGLVVGFIECFEMITKHIGFIAGKFKGLIIKFYGDDETIYNQYKDAMHETFRSSGAFVQQSVYDSSKIQDVWNEFFSDKFDDETVH